MDDSFVFMVFGLGFFLFCIWMVLHQSNLEYNRMLNERREFGYRDRPTKEETSDTPE